VLRINEGDYNILSPGGGKEGGEERQRERERLRMKEERRRIQN
jgi:hypothetical protein